jgi:hypothetical protein
LKPKLLIITVVFRDDAHLELTYESVHAGYAGPFEHHIFVKQYDPQLAAKYPRSTVVASRDTGIYNAMNLAFEALGDSLDQDDCVLFLNSGDVLQKGRLEKLVERLQPSSAVMALGAVQLTRAGEVIGTRAVTSTEVSNGRKIFFEYPCHQSTVYKAGALLDVQRKRGYLYEEGYKVCADLELYLLLSPSGVLLVDSIVADYDSSGYSDKAILQTASEKMRLARRYAGSAWLVYAGLWQAKARCAFLKRSLLGAS